MPPTMKTFGARDIKNRPYDKHITDTCRRRVATGNPPAVQGNPVDNTVLVDLAVVPVVRPVSSDSPRSCEY